MSTDKPTQPEPNDANGTPKIDQKEIDMMRRFVKKMFIKVKNPRFQMEGSVATEKRWLASIDPDEAATIFITLYTKAGSKGLSDEQLSKMLGFRETMIRRVLNKLLENDLVRYRRGKSEKGETRFFWYVNKNMLNSVLLARKKLALEKLKIRLQYEQENEFYYCPVCRIRYTFNQAYDYEFICPRCGTELVVDEDSELRAEILRRLIRELEREIMEDEKR
ncbi:MAG: hypothetical protein F7C32_00265 [Desulfurococcales archaeon]|nr:hypothetical protein [Desulfurococcales archaeon]